ncbi:MAG: haloacid dehalogenase type II [Candidatus Limnocylindria bacterium]
MSLDLGRFEAMTFDCYGTLIDWETGILEGLARALDGRGVSLPDDEELLVRYARHEAELEAGPYRTYRDILAAAATAVASDLGMTLDAAGAAAFGGSVVDWPAFPDAPAALARLATRFRLGVLTNCDDDLFAASNDRLGVTFDWVVTAQQVGSYKPSPANFDALLARVDVAPERIVHVAQSLYHDHVPAKQLGLTTVWVDRRHDRPGAGATPPATAVPDARFVDLASLAAEAVRA